MDRKMKKRIYQGTNDTELPSANYRDKVRFYVKDQLLERTWNKLSAKWTANKLASIMLGQQSTSTSDLGCVPLCFITTPSVQ